MGMPGSQHDSSCFRASKMGKNPGAFFSLGEHIIADSAYAASATVIPAYKRPRGRSMPAGSKRFNTLLSSPRVQTEIVFGVWKVCIFLLTPPPGVLNIVLRREGSRFLQTRALTFAAQLIWIF